MTDFIVQLDPPAVATNRTMLDLNSGPIRIGSTSPGNSGIDWGDAAITAYMTQQGQFGNAPSAYVYPNRTITIDLMLGADDSGTEETARSHLQQKVALIQREGGWLLRQRKGGPAMYADIVDAQLSIPDVYGETGGVEPNVRLTLTTLPDFYGDEVTLDTISATGYSAALLTQSGAQATIEGDYPARARIIVTDKSGNNQLGLLWGLRSKHYDSSSTAKLAYEAESLTPLNGATVTALTGASNGNVVEQASLPAGSWVSILSTNLASGNTPLTHVGTYRVWARCYSPGATPRLRLQWGVGSLSVPVANDAVTLPATGAFYLIDLGAIRLDAPPIGSQEWFGVVQAIGNQGDAIAVDALYLEPLDDGGGVLSYAPVAPVSSVETTELGGTYANNNGTGTVAWNTGGSPYTVTLGTASQISEYLQATGFGFNIPSSATIQGIQLSVFRTEEGGGAQGIVDHSVKLLKAGSLTGGEKAIGNVEWPITGTTQTYGSPTDLWGASWTPSDINNANFGAAFSVANLTDTQTAGEAFVSYLQLSVYYTLASGFTVVEDAVIYANQIAEMRHDGMFRLNSSGTVYGSVSQVTGDLPRLPPSGMEGRACQLFIRPTRGDVDPVPDGGLDGFTAQVKYRPCWLSRP